MDIKLKLQNLKQLQDRIEKLKLSYASDLNFLETLKAQLQMLDLLYEGLQELSQIELLGEESKMYTELRNFWQDNDFQINQLKKEVENSKATN